MRIDFERLAFLLRRIPQEVDRLQNVRWKVMKARSAAERITPALDDMPHGSGGFHSRVEDGAIRIDEITSAYREALEELNGMRSELESLIVRLDDPVYKAILRLRYLYGYTIEQLCQIQHRSRTQIDRDLKEAEQKITAMVT